MGEPMHDEAATIGPRCGNNPNVPLTPGDRQAVDEFKAYLAQRREAEDRQALHAAIAVVERRWPDSELLRELREQAEAIAPVE